MKVCIICEQEQDDREFLYEYRGQGRSARRCHGCMVGYRLGQHDPLPLFNESRLHE